MIGNYFWGGAAAPYAIEQSLRFDGSAYLSRSLGTTSSSWTVSFWTKTALNDNHDGYWFNTSQAAIYMDSSSGAPSDRRYKFRDATSGSLIVSNAVIRDPSAWYHVVYKCDGSNRRLYINNSLDAGFTYSGSTTLSGSCAIGAYYTGSGAQLEGYIAEFHFVDGSALDPDQFGELDDNGVWRPIAYTGTYGTNGFYLTFDPTATNGVGHDHSGNGNHFTASGFTTSGTGTDVMSDTPTNNFATLNPVYQPFDMSFSDGNLFFQPTASQWRSAQSTISVTGSGKYYCEMKLSSINQARMCLTSIQDPDLFNYGVPSYSSNNGLIVDDDLTAVTYGSSWSSGDVIAMAIDMDNGSVAFYKNGSLQGTVTGLDTSLLWRPGVIAYTGSSNGYFNFGQRAFEQTPPSGFNSICTANLPAPDIADGSQYFNTVLWTGNGSSSSRTIPGVGFQPDFTWIKGRSYSGSGNRLMDAVRGAGQMLQTNSQGTEFNDSANVPSFAPDGFTLTTTGSSYNALNETYVAWNWLAANGTSTPSGGSIASTVSANTTAGFSIVTYTGNGSSSATVAHGLGVAPKMVIVKVRSGSQTYPSWYVRHESMLSNHNGRLELTASTNNTVTDFYQGGIANLTSSTTFGFNAGTQGNANNVNTNGNTYVAYCFAEVEGYSKFGSYTGNGDSDGPFVFCGFKPSWIMFKHYSGTITYQSNATWNIYDAARDTYNVADAKLMANASDSEATSVGIDILSNGFKLRGAGDERNKSGGNYLFVAFASNPFGGSGVSPATAR